MDLIIEQRKTKQWSPSSEKSAKTPRPESVQPDIWPMLWEKLGFSRGRDFDALQINTWIRIFKNLKQEQQLLPQLISNTSSNLETAEW